MKLLVCDKCYAVVSLAIKSWRRCACKQSKGRYVDNQLVEVSGPCRIIGVPNELRVGQVDEAKAFQIKEPSPVIWRVEEAR